MRRQLLQFQYKVHETESLTCISINMFSVDHPSVYRLVGNVQVQARLHIIESIYL
jgi:hypothetical protein